MNTKARDLSELVGAGYEAGGRGPLWDCLGVVLLGLELLGRPIPDPWPTVREAWEAGSTDEAALAGFPCGWFELADPQPLRGHAAGTVLLRASRGSEGPVGHVDIVWRDGRVYTANEATGVIAQKWRSVRPAVLQAWQFGGAA